MPPVCHGQDGSVEYLGRLSSEVYTRADSNITISIFRDACIGKDLLAIAISKERYEAFTSSYCAARHLFNLSPELLIAYSEWRELHEEEYKPWRISPYLSDHERAAGITQHKLEFDPWI